MFPQSYRGEAEIWLWYHTKYHQCIIWHKPCENIWNISSDINAIKFLISPHGVYVHICTLPKSTYMYMRALGPHVKRSQALHFCRSKWHDIITCVWASPIYIWPGISMEYVSFCICFKGNYNVIQINIRKYIYIMCWLILQNLKKLNKYDAFHICRDSVKSEKTWSPRPPPSYR